MKIGERSQDVGVRLRVLLCGAGEENDEFDAEVGDGEATALVLRWGG